MRATHQSPKANLHPKSMLLLIFWIGSLAACDLETDNAQTVPAEDQDADLNAWDALTPDGDQELPEEPEPNETEDDLEPDVEDETNPDNPDDPGDDSSEPTEDEHDIQSTCGCETRTCGVDPCGELCGSCNAGFICQDGNCMAGSGCPNGECNATTYFAFHALDPNGENLAGVRFTTTSELSYLSDENGLVVIDAPELLGRTVWFAIDKPGYIYEPNVYGIVGKKFLVEEGGYFQVTLSEAPEGASEENVELNDAPQDFGDVNSRMLFTGPPASTDFFQFHLIDRETGKGVPLIEVRTSTKTFLSDNQGIVAYYELDGMDQNVQFEIKGHGYTYSGGTLSLFAQRGGGKTLVLDRQNVATRLYRITGSGLYSHSTRLGLPSPVASPLLNTDVTGQDSAIVIPYRDELFWIWGDTDRLGGALGNFQVTAATSDLPANSALDPMDGIDLNYFTKEDGSFVKQMAPPETVPGAGVCWFTGLATAGDDVASESLYSFYGRFTSLAADAKGLAKYNPATQIFEEVVSLPVEEQTPEGQSYRWRADGKEYSYFGNAMRVPATDAAMLNPELYETYTAKSSDGQLVRDAGGRLVYDFRADAPPMTQDLVDSGEVQTHEVPFGQMRDVITGVQPWIHNNNGIAPNDYTQRFTGVFLQSWGDSFLGEIWFANADTPVGPWVYSQKIVSHDDYTFYNPRVHPYLSGDGGRTLLFEGTYTSWLSSAEPTSRYDYNQVMYALDLEDDRANLPVPVYSVDSGSHLLTKTGLKKSHTDVEIDFFAPEKTGDALLPVWWSGASCDDRELNVGGTPKTVPLFYALSADNESNVAGTVGLFRFSNSTGETYYSTNTEAISTGFSSSGEPIAQVWENPHQVNYPVLDYLWPFLADAGSDQCVTKSSSLENVSVTVDANGSSLGSETGVAYRWSMGNQWLADGATAEISLSEGLHTLTLVMESDSGKIARDTLLVQVN
jgi:hypothetical protein